MASTSQWVGETRCCSLHPTNCSLMLSTFSFPIHSIFNLSLPLNSKSICSVLFCRRRAEWFCWPERLLWTDRQNCSRRSQLCHLRCSRGSTNSVLDTATRKRTNGAPVTRAPHTCRNSTLSSSRHAWSGWFFIFNHSLHTVFDIYITNISEIWHFHYFPYLAVSSLNFPFECHTKFLIEFYGLPAGLFFRHVSSEEVLDGHVQYPVQNCPRTMF